jgi:hypothetical protein
MADSLIKSIYQQEQSNQPLGEDYSQMNRWLDAVYLYVSEPR